MCHFCKSTPIFPILSIFSSLGFKLWYKNTNIYLKEKRGVIMLSAFFTYLPANVMVLLPPKQLNLILKIFEILHYNTPTGKKLNHVSIFLEYHVIFICVIFFKNVKIILFTGMKTASSQKRREYGKLK